MARCFVSYTSVDEPWAEWIGEALRDAGHEVSLQSVDFRPGENFVVRMQQSAAQADHTIVVLSNRYLASEFATAEWAAAFAADPTGEHRALIPVAIEPVSPPGLWRAIIRIDLFSRSEDEARRELLDAIGTAQRQRAAFPQYSGQGGRPGQVPGPGSHPLAVEVWRLPPSDGLLIGRQDQLDLLNRCWAEPAINLVTIVGWGGSGKTSLLNHWLATMAAAQYRGANRVFAWSFDSQATGGQVATSDQFIDGALRFFGLEGTRSTPVWERCRQITTLFQQSRTLLILDGLDRIQEPPGRSGGTLKEPAVQMLVRELSAFNLGLCVLTSRLPVTDVQPFVGHTCTNVNLGPLSVEDAARLLVEEGVVGDEAMILKTAREAHCHPLTLRLLGSFIRTVYHGEIRTWNASGLASALDHAGDDTAGRVMDEYASWFTGRPESQILSSIGMFDRPATDGELRSIRTGPAMDGLNSLLVSLTDVQWAYAVRNLVAAGLVMQRADLDEALDAHPLVRSHFGADLRERWPEAFREGHRRICTYLSATAPHLPQSLDESLPLLSAVWHGTQAGLDASMLREIYWPRLAQDSHQLRDVLGAAAANYAVLSYIVPAGRTNERLSQVEIARVLCDQALDLRMLGRPQDAISPLRQGAAAAAEADDHALGANALRHLAQLHLTLGQFAEARSTADAAYQRAARLGDGHVEAIASRLTLADVENHLAEPTTAEELVARVMPHLADEELGRSQAHRATLYISAFRAVEISMSAAEQLTGDTGAGRLSDRRLTDLRHVTTRLARLNDSTRRLSLPRALMRLASALLDIVSATLTPSTTTEIDLAIVEIRESGQRPWLVQGLLVRASLFRTLGAFDTASASLTEARSLCVIDGMLTRQLDCDLEAAKIEIASGNAWQGQIMLNSLGRVAARLGYRRVASSVHEVDPTDTTSG